MKHIKNIIFVSAALALTGCETTQNTTMEKAPDGRSILTELGPPAEKLAPMPMPDYFPVGEKFVFLRKGKEQTFEVLEADEKSETILTNSGCKYTEPKFVNNLTTFSPSISWKGCRGFTGHANVTVNGELFPLKLGNKVTYSVQGEDTKGSWTGTWTQRRVCKVNDQLRIQTPGGEFDTWKIVCKDKKNKRTFYMSPELGHAVAFKRKHYSDSSRTYTSVFLRKG